MIFYIFSINKRFIEIIKMGHVRNVYPLTCSTFCVSRCIESVHLQYNLKTRKRFRSRDSEGTLKTSLSEDSYLSFRLRFNSGIAIETTKTVKRMELVNARTMMVKMPSMRQEKKIRKPNK